MTLAERIRHWSQRLPSQRAIARKLGCSEAHVSMVLRGHRGRRTHEDAARANKIKEVAARDGVSCAAIRMRISRYGENEAFNGKF